MTVITADEFLKTKARWLERIAMGDVFIYPTDTIYGIGCDATDARAVQTIRVLKQRDSKPFSVIAPSKAWIAANCVLSADANHWLGKLPGPYTLILPLKNPHAVAHNVNDGATTIGVRIPHHWIALVSQELGKPLVTTSVNRTGEPYAATIASVPRAMLENVAFVINEGPLQGKPSTIVDCVGPTCIVRER